MPRHRDPERRDEEILAAVLELVEREGYDRVTLDAIAAAARASKTTLYRRWPTKAAMVVDALHRQSPLDPGIPDTGTLRGDLVETIALIARELTAHADLVIGLLSAARRDDDLLAALHARLRPDREAFSRLAIDRAVGRGELPEEVDRAVVDDVALPLLMHRVLMQEEALDDAFVEHIVDGIVLPLLSAAAIRVQPPSTPPTGGGRALTG